MRKAMQKKARRAQGKPPSVSPRGNNGGGKKGKVNGNKRPRENQGRSMTLESEGDCGLERRGEFCMKSKEETRVQCQKCLGIYRETHYFPSGRTSSWW